MKKSLFIIIFVIVLIFVMVSSVFTYRFTMKYLVALNNNNLKGLLYYKAEEVNSYLTEENYLFKKFYEKNLKNCNSIEKIENIFENFWGNHNFIVSSVLITTDGSIIFKEDKHKIQSSTQLFEFNLKTFFANRKNFDVYSLEKFLNRSSPNLFFVSNAFKIQRQDGSSLDVAIIGEYNFNKILHGLSTSTEKKINTMVDFWVLNKAGKVVGSSMDLDSLNDIRALFDSIPKNNNYDFISAPFVMHGDNCKLMMTINNRSYVESIISPKMIIIFFVINIGIIFIMLFSVPFFIQSHKKYKKLKNEATLLKIKLDLSETEKVTKNIEASDFFKVVRNNNKYSQYTEIEKKERSD